jgi:threonine synthase
MRPYLGGFFSDDEFKGLIAKAYARVPPRRPRADGAAGSNHFLLELFHGPTLAFKDFAMQLIGQMMQAALAKTGERITIVGATSGDTGSAAMEAFRGLANVDVFILFPHGRVSEVQRRQMTTPSEANVHALAMDGDFRRLSGAREGHVQRFRLPRRGAAGGGEQHQLGAGAGAGGVLFLCGCGPWCAASAVSFTVPTGNFGDIFAGYIAQCMGLPIDQLVIATNQNDILDRALRRRLPDERGQASISPSMDIQVSSNFERALFDAYGRDGAAIASLMDELKAGGFRISQGALESLRATFASGRCSEDETLATIARHWKRRRASFVPAFRRGGEGGRGAYRPRPDDHAGDGASGEVPRCGGARTGIAPACRRIWRSVRARPSG